MKVCRTIESAQIALSTQTRGPGDRQRGVCEQIRKELADIEADPDDLDESIDVVILVLDGAWRQCVKRGSGRSDVGAARTNPSSTAGAARLRPGGDSCQEWTSATCTRRTPT